MKKFYVSVLVLLFVFLPISGECVNTGNSMVSDVNTVLSNFGTTVSDYDNIRNVSINWDNNADISSSSNAVLLTRALENNETEIVIITACNHDTGFLDVHMNGTRLSVYDGVPFDASSICMTLYGRYVTETGVDGHEYHRPSKLGILVESNSSASALSTVNYITARYKIVGASYAYPDCLHNSSPSPNATNSSLEVNCVYNHPVSGGQRYTTNLSTTRAIRGTGGHYDQGKIGAAIVYNDGTSHNFNILTVDP